VLSVSTADTKTEPSANTDTPGTGAPAWSVTVPAIAPPTASAASTPVCVWPTWTGTGVPENMSGLLS
jgi:hypothetical protein